MSLEISLLGQIELRLDDRPLPLPATRKAQSLLAYLVTHPDRPHPREQLANLFWPDHPRDKALHNLSTALWHIRRVLPPGNYLLTNTQTMQFNPRSDFWLDVKEFEEAVIRDRGSGVGQESLISDPSSLISAIKLYRGDFLESFYDDWCLEERYHLESLFLGALERLIALCQERDEPEAALEYARWLLLRDPLREDIHRQVMRLHARQGDQAAILQQYLQCQAVLRDQLGIEPAPETTALCQELTGEVPRTPLLPVSAPHLGSGHSALGAIRPQLVERTQDLVTVQAAWERACRGHGHMVLVEGEAGIGKTRLLEEFAAQVRWQGGQIAQGCCYEYDRPLPYCAITEALHNLSGRLPLSALGELPAWMLAEVSRLAPEIGEMQTDLPPSIEEKASLQQTRLLEALTRFLKTISSHFASPLLLVLDDLHWASDSTLTFLQYFAPRLGDAPILLVGAFRGEELSPDHALRGLLRRMKRRGQATGLHLQRLSPAGVMALVQAISGCGDEIFPLAQCLHRETEGNPFFLLETIRALFEAGSLQFQEGRWRGDWIELAGRASLSIPPGVEALIRARVSRLTPATQEALALAAVAGQAFDFDVLEQAWGQEEEAALLAVEELLRGQVIVEGQGAAARDYAFDHSKVREVVYATTHYRRRRRFHRLIGQAMEAIYKGQPGIAAELAHHFERAGETEKALAWLVVAGEQAWHGYALQEALDYFRRALVLLAPDRADAIAARVLTRAAAAHRDVVGEDEQAWGWLERALAIWEALGNWAGVAEVCYVLAYRHADFDQARSLVHRGLQAVQEVDGLERMVARGYGLLARFYEHEGDFAQARFWAQRQLELSEQIGDQHELAHAHHRLGSLCLRIGGPMREALAHERQAARLAEDMGWLDFAAGSHNIAGYCLLALGCTPEAEAECNLALRLSTELDIPWRQCWAFHYLAEIASLQGEWEQAAKLLDRAEKTMIHQSTHFQEIVLLRARGQVAARQDDPGAAWPLLETALELSQRFYPRYVPELEMEMAALSLDEGDERIARQRLGLAREAAQRRGMAHALAIAGRLQGQLSARSGDWSTAEMAFAESLRRCEELEQVVEAARTRLVWGQMLLLHDAPRARSLLEAALATFEAAKAYPETDKVRCLLA